MVNGPLPSLEDQQTLLQDVRAKRDIFVQEKARIENLLNSYLEKVKIYQALLGSTESQICKIEDLIGDIRLRLRERGILVNSVFSSLPVPTSDVRASPLPAPSETACELSHE